MRTDQSTEHAWLSDDPAACVVRQGREILASDGDVRLTDADAALTLYHGSTRYSFRTDTRSNYYFESDPAGYNMIRSLSDTLISALVRNKVRPMFVTEAGDSELKEKAKGMQRAVESEFMRVGIWGPLGAQVCRHGCLFSAGGVKITPDYAKRRADISLVYAHEILVSPLEAERGNPRQMWHVQTVPRETLLAQYEDDEEAREAILSAQPTSSPSQTRQYSGTDQIADLVEVWEYWHLPSCYVDKDDKASWGKDSKGNPDPDVDPGHDGRHIICIEGFLLTDEPWVFDYFPVALFRPFPAPVGYWSCGIPEQLAANQIELNKLEDRINRIIHMHAVPRIVMWDRAKINPAKISNNIADILVSKEQPAQAIYYLTPQAVPGQVFERGAQIIERSREQLGISNLSVSAQKPLGVDHAPGMQTILDSESVRQTTVFRAWEEFHTTASRILVDVFRTMAEYMPDFSVVWGDSKQLRHIKWRDVDMSDERFHLRVWPTNLLPQTPAAKLSTAMTMYESQFWTKDQTATALDFPDIESISGDITAAQENCERLLDDATNGKPGATPEPYMNLEMLRTATVSRINRLEADRDSEEKIERLRDLWTQTNKLIQMANPPAPPGPPVDPMAPAAPPTAGPIPAPAMG